MKIASTDHLEQVRQSTQNRASGPDQRDQGFSKLLEEPKANAPSGGQPSLGPGSIGHLENSPLVGMILANQGIADKATKVDRQLANTLDTMEQYAAALGDATKSPRDLEPLAHEMEKAAGQLSELSRGLPDNSPLKGMSNDAAILATVEAMKFKRGDYV